MSTHDRQIGGTLFLGLLAVSLVFVLGYLTAGDVEADDTGPWTVVLDGKGQSGVLLNTETGELYVMNREISRYYTAFSGTVWVRASLVGE